LEEVTRHAGHKILGEVDADKLLIAIKRFLFSSYFNQLDQPKLLVYLRDTLIAHWTYKILDVAGITPI
jgi:hypothetical protein